MEYPSRTVHMQHIQTVPLEFIRSCVGALTRIDIFSSAIMLYWTDTIFFTTNFIVIKLVDYESCIQLKPVDSQFFLHYS